MLDDYAAWSAEVRFHELDAAMPLLVSRARHLSNYRLHGSSPGAEFVVGDVQTVNEHLWALAMGSQELLAVSCCPMRLENFEQGHERNAYLVRRGLRMLSLFNASAYSVDPRVRELIVTAEGMPYQLACGQLMMKVYDRRVLTLEGPLVGGERVLMVMRDRATVDAGLRYVAAVRSTAVRALSVREPGEDLTRRQRMVAELLEAGLRDEEIAGRLGVSLRTVRSDVASLMAHFGTETRFAAGARFARSTAQPQSTSVPSTPARALGPIVEAYQRPFEPPVAAPAAADAR